MASSRFSAVPFLAGVLLAAAVAPGAARAVDLADVAARPLGEPESFRPVTAGRLGAAAARLREAIGPLDRLLARSASGADWKEYLDWPALVSQAASGSAADPVVLRRLQKLLDAEENGLEMPQFAAVRRAVTAYAEAATAAKDPGAAATDAQRLEKLAAAVAAGAAAGTPSRSTRWDRFWPGSRSRARRRRRSPASGPRCSGPTWSWTWTKTCWAAP